MEASGAGLCIENHLGAAKQRDDLGRLLVCDHGIPDLRCLSKVHRCGNTLNRSLSGSAEMIGL